ncbi:TetR/AcrR family transcriptional regulator [Micromonospora sp. NBC_01699]|uniref:TetR/AcrR family transcriptional regulator n=1 Tax=Micromonospora sp. NBC_01699 TaxID=2975984 RepID=UPI002E316F1E|nr:TetR/AcrR family transcriptional regulator [Micromonospora sp. NBC_01699]
MSPRPLAFTDDRILSAAASAIADIGPAALTLADVAQRTGASPATLVKRFGSKRGLLVAVSRRGVQDVTEAFREPRREGVSALDRLEDVLAGLTGGIKRHEQMAHHVAFLMMDLTDPELYAQAGDFTAALRDGIRGLLAEAARTGELAGAGAGAELDELAEALLIAYNGMMITWALQPRGVLGDRVRGQFRFLLRPYRRRLDP